MRTSASARIAALIGLSALLATGAACTFENAGATPPAFAMYFPTALALGPPAADGEAPGYLYIVNSNFDRRYNAGRVMSVDLDVLEARVDRALEQAESPDTSEAERAASRCPQRGRDCIIDLDDRVIADSVVIGSMGRGAALSANNRYLYVPTAVDNGLTYIELRDDGALDCGQRKDLGRCASGFVVGDDRTLNTRDVTLPGDPIAVAAGAFGDYLDDGSERQYAVVAYRQGEVALFVHEDDENAQLELADLRTNLGGNLTGLAYDPTSQLLHVTTTVNSPGRDKYLRRIGVLADPNDPLSSALYRTDDLSLQGVAKGPTTWAAQFVERAPDADGGARSTGYIVSQGPNALLRIEMDEDTGNDVTVSSITPVGIGASRLAQGTLDTDAGPLEIVVVSCFIQRQSRIYIVEANSGRALSIVAGFSGPFEMQLDAPRKRLYVGDFSASVVRIVDLTPLEEGGEAEIIATLGQPKVVEELQ